MIRICASFSYIGHRNYMVKVFVNHIYYNIKYYPWSYFLDLDIFLYMKNKNVTKEIYMPSYALHNKLTLCTTKNNSCFRPRFDNCYIYTHTITIYTKLEFNSSPAIASSMSIDNKITWVFMLYRRVHRQRDVCNGFFISLETYRSNSILYMNVVIIEVYNYLTHTSHNNVFFCLLCYCYLSYDDIPHLHQNARKLNFLSVVVVP